MWQFLNKTSLLAKYVYTHKEFDSGLVAPSILSLYRITTQQSSEIYTRNDGETVNRINVTGNMTATCHVE